MCTNFGVFLSYSPSYIFKLIFIYVYVCVLLYFTCVCPPTEAGRGVQIPSSWSRRLLRSDFS